MKKRPSSPIKIVLTPLAALTFAIVLSAGYFLIPLISIPPINHLHEGDILACFTPNQKCQNLIIEEISQAKTSIHVQAYSFTDKDIAQALVKAAERGVSVKVILDKSNVHDKHSAKDLITQSHIPLRIDSPSGIAHNKIIIIDAQVVLTGSYNFSAAAYKRNTENLLLIHNPALATTYLTNWTDRWNRSH